MKTEITKFCAESLEALKPLPDALNQTVEHLEAGSDKELLAPVLHALNDVRARLRSLVEKLTTQQAYLLIFGPLKSGKSTLMNALSASYVSEVTSLPGYPCLVFVRHAQEPHFSATRYNGRETVFADGRVLKEVISDSHFALAEQIRASEKRGEAFDPRTTFTEAIRRIDIKLPVQSLAESGTVLVDTPGLYSRMNFGYDVLTKEFRNSAACAVFVVKTDNLFLEQVFAEFTQLLDLFSRIFLVINVDSNKRDLQPDGSLLPSAESAEPQRVIEAFTTLCMAGPLRKAHEDGRLRLHAVDLLNAASSFLSNGNGNGNGAANGTDRQRIAFEAFVKDLTDYLNSSDYTHEFIRDSLRQGTLFCQEAITAAKGEAFEELRNKQQQLREEVAGVEEKLAALERLRSANWEAAFEPVKRQHTERTGDAISTRAAQLGKDLRAVLEGWYESGESLRDLADTKWNALLREGGAVLANESAAGLRRALTTPLGGAEPGAATIIDLQTAGLSLTPVAAQAQAALNAQPDLAGYDVTLGTDDLPVRKTIGDWLLFRGIASVRRRLFGDDLSQPIAAEIKAKRLQEPSRAALQEKIDHATAERFPKLPQAHADRLLSDYVAKFKQGLQTAFGQRQTALEQERADLQAPFEANARILATLDTLRDSAGQAIADLERIAADERGLGHTVPALATDPAPETIPVEEVTSIGEARPA
jgi:signal recognition particle receptor subunit beta